MTTYKKNNLLKPSIFQEQRSRSKSSSSRVQNKKLSLKKNQYTLEAYKQSYTQLPRRSQSQRITTTKNEQSQSYYYKYKDEPNDLDKRSSISEMESFISNLILKSQNQELTSTERYMLSGYIDVYIKENYISNQIKDNSTLTVQKLKCEWSKLSNAWQLYCIKRAKCQMGWEWQQRQQKADQNFQALQQEMLKIDKSKQKLQPIKKLIKKFYLELVDF